MSRKGRSEESATNVKRAGGHGEERPSEVIGWGKGCSELK